MTDQKSKTSSQFAGYHTARSSIEYQGTLGTKRLAPTATATTGVVLHQNTYAIDEENKNGAIQQIEHEINPFPEDLNEYQTKLSPLEMDSYQLREYMLKKQKRIEKHRLMKKKLQTERHVKNLGFGREPSEKKIEKYIDADCGK